MMVSVRPVTLDSALDFIAPIAARASAGISLTSFMNSSVSCSVDTVAIRLFSGSITVIRCFVKSMIERSFPKLEKPLPSFN